MPEQTRGLIQHFWQTMNTNNFRAVGDLLHDDFVLHWPQSGERIRGRDNFAAVNEHYPAAGRWRFTVHQIVADDDSAASDVTVTDGVTIARVISFFELRHGRIARMTEFWPDPMEAAAWRSQWVEQVG